uniref:Uncharacterized protein n=1 Tax=Arundo donax TaxID=35708 RepID=A0A0A8YKD0_ARUDO
MGLNYRLCCLHFTSSYGGLGELEVVEAL